MNASSSHSTERYGKEYTMDATLMHHSPTARRMSSNDRFSACVYRALAV